MSMFTPSRDGKITPCQILLPLTLLAFVVFLLLGYQMTQIMREHQNWTNAKNTQNEAVQQAQKVQTQLDALAVGTLRLSEKGNKSAKAIIDRMKQLGITVKDNAAVPTPAPAPKAAPVPAPAKAATPKVKKAAEEE